MTEELTRTCGNCAKTKCTFQNLYKHKLNTCADWQEKPKAAFDTKGAPISKYSYWYESENGTIKGELCVQCNGINCGAKDYRIALFCTVKNNPMFLTDFLNKDFWNIEDAQIYLDEYAKKHGLMTLQKAVETGKCKWWKVR